MKVKELIEILSKLDQDFEIRREEGGLADCEIISVNEGWRKNTYAIE